MSAKKKYHELLFDNKTPEEVKQKKKDEPKEPEDVENAEYLFSSLSNLS